MKRDVLSHLQTWFAAESHAPLVLRGARQVGKSHLVRELAKAEKVQLIELNFERDPDLVDLFRANDPRATLSSITAWARQPIDLSRSVLFLDEVQAAPAIVPKLRWFAEEMPELHIVAAGSLLDFALAEPEFSVPVGRLTLMYLEPMSFAEFVTALAGPALRQFLDDFRVGHSIAAPLHRQLLALFRDYLLVGGMPAVVDRYRRTASLGECSVLQSDLLTTYRDDFGKYASRVHHSRLQKVLSSVPRQLGQKFKFTKVDRDERSAALRQALDLLCMARVCHRVLASDATGLPLGADTDPRRFKVIFLDVGLVSALLGLTLDEVQRTDELVLVNGGGLAEQAVGQALRSLAPAHRDPELYYWAREQPGAESELDYVIQRGAQIVPIEVKAGATGSLKSLHLFMALRGRPRAVRFNSQLPSVADLDVKTRDGVSAHYQLVSLPLYLAGQLATALHDG